MILGRFSGLHTISTDHNLTIAYLLSTCQYEQFIRCLGVNLQHPVSQPTGIRQPARTQQRIIDNSLSLRSCMMRIAIYQFLISSLPLASYRIKQKLTAQFPTSTITQYACQGKLVIISLQCRGLRISAKVSVIAVVQPKQDKIFCVVAPWHQLAG